MESSVLKILRVLFLQKMINSSIIPFLQRPNNFEMYLVASMLQCSG